MRLDILLSAKPVIAVLAVFLLSPASAQLCPPCAKDISKPAGSGTESGRTILNVWLDSSWGTPPPQIIRDGLDQAMSNWNTKTSGGQTMCYKFKDSPSASAADIVIVKSSTPTCGDNNSPSSTIHTIRINPVVLQSSTYVVRGLLRHELGHSVGLANADNDCPQTSSVMQGAFTGSCTTSTNDVRTSDIAKVRQWCQNPATCDVNVGSGGIGLPVGLGYCPIQNNCEYWAWVDGYLAGEDLDYCKWEVGCGGGFTFANTTGGSCCVADTSPVVVDVLGDGFDLTSSENGVFFDLDGDGTLDRLSWTAIDSDDAWLFLDRNNNGRVDDGTELFGNFSPQPPSENPNGFIALAVYDEAESGGNGDGKIGPEDAIYSQLLMWQDLDHDGMSGEGELSTLDDANVAGMSLHYLETKWQDAHGNLFKYRVKLERVENMSGATARWAYDVSLVRDYQ